MVKMYMWLWGFGCAVLWPPFLVIWALCIVAHFGFSVVGLVVACSCINHHREKDLSVWRPDDVNLCSLRGQSVPYIGELLSFVIMNVIAVVIVIESL